MKNQPSPPTRTSAAYRMTLLAVCMTFLYGCSGGLGCGGGAGGCVNAYEYPSSGLQNGVDQVDDGARMRMTQAALDFLDVHLKDILIGALGASMTDPDTIALEIAPIEVIGGVNLGQGVAETYPTSILIQASDLTDRLDMRFVQAGETVMVGGEAVTVPSDGVLLDAVDIPVGIDARLFTEVCISRVCANAGCDVDGSNPDYCAPGSTCGTITGLTLGILVYPDVGTGAACDVPGPECLNISVDVVKADLGSLGGNAVDISVPPFDDQDCNSANPPLNCSPECSDQNAAENIAGISPAWECTAICFIEEFGIDLILGIAGLIEPLIDGFLDELLTGAIANALQDIDGSPIAISSRFSLKDTVGEIAPGNTLDLGYGINPAGNAFDVNCPSGQNCAETKGMDLIFKTGFEAAPDEVMDTPVPHPCVRAVQGQEFATLFGGAQFESTSNVALTGEYEGQPYHLGASIAEAMVRQALFGVYNTGVTCLEIDTDAVYTLTGGLFPLAAGTIDLLTEGKLRQFADPSAPATITLTPHNPPVVTLGSGLDTDGHINISWEDVEVSFYVLTYERTARVFAVSTDISLSASVFTDPVTQTLKFSVVDGPTVDGFEQRYGELLPEVDFSEVLESLIGIAFDAALGDGLEFEFDVGSTLGDALGIPLYTRFDAIETVPAGNPDYLNIYVSLTTEPPPDPEMRTAAILNRPVLHPTSGLFTLRDVPHEDDVAPVLEPTGQVHLTGAQFPLHTGYEYFAQIDFGLMRGPFVVDDEGVLVVHDPRLKLTGEHRLLLRGRPIGVPSELDAESTEVRFFVDPSRPRVRLAVSHRAEGDVLVAEGSDIGSYAGELRYAWRIDDDEAGAYSDLSERSVADLEDAERISVRAMDPAGNVSFEATVDLSDAAANPEHAERDWAQDRLDPAHAPNLQGGCSALGVNDDTPWNALAVLPLFALIGTRRRRRR